MLSQVERSRVTSLLENFDCNEREVAIYIQCLSMEPSGVQEIARCMGMNRLTVHSAIEQLIQKGMLYETRKGKRRLIAAEPPDVLFRLLERKEEDMNKLRSNIDYTAKLLQSLQPVIKGRPSVRFYEGADGFKKMLKETLSARGEVLVFSYVPMLAKAVEPDYLEEYFKKRGRKGIKTRLIFPPCKFAERVEAHAEAYRIKIRYLPKTYEWQSGIFAWDKNVALLSYTENRLTCTIIENPDIAHFYRNVIFELCWAQGEEK